MGRSAPLGVPPGGGALQCCVRTDQHHFCPRCFVRFSPTPSCPRCRGSEVFDLRDPGAYARVVEARDEAREGGGGERAADAVARGIRVGIAIIGATIAYGILVSLVDAAVGASVPDPVAALAVAGLILLFLASICTAMLLVPLAIVWIGLRLAGHGDVTLRPITIPEEDPPAGRGLRRDVVRGRVRAREPILSPLARKPCVAFRLVGGNIGGALDDGGATTFEVEGEHGVIAVVAAESATVALDRAAVHPWRPADDEELRAFLEPRAVYPELGALDLGEALLSEGDEVIVEGTALSRAHPQASAGYRDGGVPVYRDREGSPLVIRRVQT